MQGQMLKSGGASGNVRTLSSEQQEAVDYIYERDYSLLIAGTGTGKTIISLTAITELIQDNIINRCIVLCPANVVTGWLKEVREWGLPVTIAGGTGQKFIDSIKDSDIQILVTSYESSFKLLSSVNADGIVFDEITRLKESGGTTYRGINKYIKNFNWKLGLSATPLSESWESSFAIAKILDGGQSFGRNKQKFMSEYFNQLDYKGYKFEVKPDKINELSDKLIKFSYIIDESVKRKIMLKPSYLLDIKINVSDEIMQLQEQLIQDSIITVDGVDIVAVNAAVLSGKLRQLAQGFIIDEDEQVHWIDKSRINACESQINKRLKSGAIVCTYEYSCIGDEFKTIYPDADFINGQTTKAEFNEIMVRWRKGSGQLLFLQVRAGSHGLDGLQFSSHQMLHFAPIWSRDATLQLEGRLDRTGQNKQVEIQSIIATNSIDVEVTARVELKGEVFEQFLNRIKG